MAPPIDPIPDTIGTRYVPTSGSDEEDPPDQFVLYQSICMQGSFQNYSQEELRWADRSLLPTKNKSIYQLVEALEQKCSSCDESESKAVGLKEGLEALKQEFQELQKQAAGLAQGKEALKRTMKETVDARSEKMRQTLKDKLVEESKKIRAEIPIAVAKAKKESIVQRLSELSDPEARELLSANPTVRKVVAANVKTKVEQGTEKVRVSLRAEYEAKMTSLRAEYEAKLKVCKMNLSGKLGQSGKPPATTLPAASTIPPTLTSTTNYEPSAPGATNPATAKVPSGCGGTSKLTNLTPPATPLEIKKPDSSATSTRPSTLQQISALGVPSSLEFQRSASVPPNPSAKFQAPAVDSSFGSLNSPSLSSFLSAHITPVTFGTPPVTNLFGSKSISGTPSPFVKPSPLSSKVFGFASTQTTSIFGSTNAPTPATKLLKSLPPMVVPKVIGGPSTPTTKPTSRLDTRSTFHTPEPSKETPNLGSLTSDSLSYPSTGQKRDREEDTGRAEDEVKRGCAESPKKETKLEMVI